VRQAAAERAPHPDRIVRDVSNHSSKHRPERAVLDRTMERGMARPRTDTQARQSSDPLKAPPRSECGHQQAAAQLYKRGSVKWGHARLNSIVSRWRHRCETPHILE
jgi:hypothetical protein